jgi:hypothetical protein
MLVQGVREVNRPEGRVIHMEGDILLGHILSANDQIIFASFGTVDVVAEGFNLKSTGVGSSTL